MRLASGGACAGRIVHPRAPRPAAAHAGRRSRRRPPAAPPGDGPAGARLGRVLAAQLAADGAGHLPALAARAVLGDRPRRQGLPGLASAGRDRPGDRPSAPSATSTAATRRLRPVRVGRRALRGAPAVEAYSGIPFGAATEALEDWAGANRAPRRGGPRRLQGRVRERCPAHDGRGRARRDLRLPRPRPPGLALARRAVEQRPRAALRVRCSDGTEIISNIVSRFGDAGEYTRGCDAAVTVATTDYGYPDGPGERLIPDRACMESGFLVPAGRTTSVWAPTSSGARERAARPAGGACSRPTTPPSASSIPSRYGEPRGRRIARTLDLCRETEPSGDRANGRPATRPRDRHRRVRRPALAVRRHPPRHLPARHDASPTRAGRGAGGPTPTAATPRPTVPGRDLPARRAADTPARPRVHSASSAATAPTTPPGSTPPTKRVRPL